MWRVFSASATGKRNLEQGTPGQDASDCVVTGDALVAVVCDGAGSVQEGQAGSEFVAHSLTGHLAGALPAHGATELEAAIRSAIAAVRERLAVLAASRQLDLHEFSCTLVGCVVSPGGGFFFHIGDGFGIWQDAGAGAVLSVPENGEYADETYFLTDGNWSDHLRLTPLPSPGPAV